MKARLPAHAVILRTEPEMLGDSGEADITAELTADASIPFVDVAETDAYLLATLMDNIPDNIYFKDIQSRFIRINRSMATYLGLDSPEEGF